MKTYRGIPVMTKEDRSNKQKEKRIWCRENGVCVGCGCRPARESKTKCQGCANKNNRYKYNEDGKKLPQFRDYDNRYSRERWLRIKNQVNEYKLQKGCVVCGYNEHYIALDFDHLPGHDKVNNIAVLCARGNTWETIKREIDKCEVVCSNCHRIRTWERGEWH